MNRVLITIIGILSIIVVVEVGYYFYLEKNQLSSGANSSKIEKQNDNFLHDFKASSSAITVSSHSFTSGSIESKIIVHGITPYFLDTITIGTITRIHPTPGIIVGEDVKYFAALNIEGVLMGNPIWVLFDESDYKNLKVFKKVDGSTKAISFNDLQVGDSIIEKESYDLLNKKTSLMQITVQ